MNPNTVLEGLLRPPVELYSAATSISVAAAAAVAPWSLMMPPLLGWVTAGVAAGFAGVRLRQAMKVLRYQHGMKFYQVTRVAPSRLPVTPERLYLGQGFEWKQVHAQRRHDAAEKSAEPFIRPSALETGLRKTGQRLMESKSSSPIAKLGATVASWDAWFNPLHPYPDLGGTPILHGVGGMDEEPVALRQSARSGHMLVMGTTRVGKTRLLELLVTQDIHAGKVVVVIDPKGDADLMLRMVAEAKRAGREQQFYMFHLGYPDISARYNGIGNFARITEVASRATNALPSSGNSAAFKEFSWRFSNIVAQAQVALGRVPTYASLLKDVTGIDGLFMDYATMVFEKLAEEGRFADWRERVERIQAAMGQKGSGIPIPRSLQDRDPQFVAMFLWIKEATAQGLDDKVLTGLAAAFSYERSFYEKIIASLGPFLEKLTTGAVGQLISPDYFDTTDKRPIFDWMSVMRQGGIVYVGLDALSDAVVSSAVGNSMLADLVSVGGKLYKEGLDPDNASGALKLPEVCCHFDEVNEIAGPEFIPMVNKLGGSGFKITAYTQSSHDLEARMGDKAKAGQVLDNFNHLVMLRVRSTTTAALLADQVQQVQIAHLTPMSGVTDTAAQGTGVDFTSRNDDIVTYTKTPLIEASDILALPQGQAFALLEGNRLYKIRIPLADTKGDAFIPESLQKVAADMKRRYRSSETWASETDWLGSLGNLPWLSDQPLGDASVGLIDTELSGAARSSTDDEGDDNVLGHSAVLGQIAMRGMGG